MNLHFCFCIKQMMRVTYRQIVFFRRRPKTGILMAEVTRWWGQRSFFCSFLPNVNTLLFLLPSFTKVANWASKYATSPPLVTLLLGVGTMSPNRSRLSILNAYGVKWNLLKRFFDISNPQLTPALPTQPGAEPVRGLRGQNWRELSFRATGLKFGSIDLWS